MQRDETKHSRRRKKGRRLLVVVVLLITAVASWSLLQKYKAAKEHAAREQQIRSSVAIGMSEADMRKTLVNAGFKPGTTEQPVKDENVFSILIPIDESPSISFFDTAWYVVTGGDHPFAQAMYVIVELDDQGIVTQID